MNSLNNHIAMSDKFTGKTDGIPATDHSEQMNYAMGYAQRAAAASQQPAAPPPEPMKPIVPMAN